MLNTNDYFTYLEYERLLVCCSCRYCLQPHGIERHLRTEHKGIPLAVRKKLVNYTKALSLVDPVDIGIPNDPILAFECLDVTKGFMCLHCEALCGTEVSMIKYC